MILEIQHFLYTRVYIYYTKQFQKCFIFSKKNSKKFFLHISSEKCFFAFLFENAYRQVNKDS